MAKGILKTSQGLPGWSIDDRLYNFWTEMQPDSKVALWIIPVCRHHLIINAFMDSSFISQTCVLNSYPPKTPLKSQLKNTFKCCFQGFDG